MAENKKEEVKKVSSKTPKKETKTTKKTETKKVDTKKTETKKDIKKETKTTKLIKDIKKVENKKEINTEKKEVAKKEKKVVEAKAILRYERIAPSKVNIVARLIRGKDIEEAFAILKFTSKAASPILIKLLNSAIANAVNNYNMDRNKLYISEIFVNVGPILKRMRPRARGSGFRINKRTSHIEVTLKEREEK